MLNFFKNERFYLLYPIFFGIGIGVFFALPQDISVIFPVVCLLCLISLLFIFNNKSVLVLLIMAILGFIYSDFRAKEASHNVLDAKISFVEITGLVTNIYENGGFYSIVLENVKNAGDYDIFVPNKLKVSVRKDKSIKYGDIIKGKFNLYPPAMPASFYDNNDMISMWFDGIGAKGYSVSKIEILAYETLKDLKYYRLKMQNNIADFIKTHLKLKERQVALAFGVGITGQIDRGLKTAYQNSGIAHLLSVSGMHMSLVSLMVFYVIRTLLALSSFIALRYDIKKISAVVAMISATLYLMVSGMMIPALRAYIMVMVFLFAILCDRKAISLRNLGISAFIILLIRPDSLLSVSFQMSFMAITMIIALYEKFEIQIINRLKGKGFFKKTLAFIIGILAIDFIASLATMPFAMAYFNRTPLYSLFGNFVSSPVFSMLVMPFLGLGIVTRCPFFMDIAGFGIKIINLWAEYVSDLDGVVYNKAMNGYFLSLAIISLLLFVFLKGRAVFVPILLYVVAISSPIFTKVPDFMINETGDLFAFKDNDGRLWFNQTNKKKSLIERWNLKAGISKKEYEKIKPLQKDYFKNICSKDACIYKDFVVMKDKKGCVKGKVVVDLSWFSCDVLGAITINRKDLFLGGTHSFFIEKDGKITYKTAKDKIGKRLWNDFLQN